MSHTDSGLMVGNYMLGFCFGAFIMWCLVKRHADMWRHSALPVILAALTCQLVGSAVYCFITVEATHMAHGARHWWHSHTLSRLILLARFMSGVGSGFCQQFYVAAQLHITPVPARPEHTGRWVFSGMLAIGLGPMVAAALQLLDSPDDVSRNFTHVGFAQLVIVLGAMAAASLYHPKLEDVQDSMEEESHVKSGEVSEPRRRCMLICGCLLLGWLRSFGVAGVEVAMASLLEGDYHWDKRTIGLAIGVAFLCCIPAKIAHMMCGDKLSSVVWIWILSGASIVGCQLLFSSGCAVIMHLVWTSCDRTLMLAGAVLFPSFYLAEALTCGIMHQHVLPKGSWFDGNHTQLLYFLAQGSGRFLGPWAARRDGQDTFAMEQMIACVVFLFIFESLVRPFRQT